MRKSKGRLTELSGYNIATIFIVAIVIMIFIVCKDRGCIEAIKWLVAISLMAVLFRPLITFSGLKLNGYGAVLIFATGFGLSFLLTWFVCALTGIPYNTITCYLGMAAMILIGIAGNYSLKDRKIIKPVYCKEQCDRYLLELSVFFLLFAVAFYIKGFKPIIDFQTEQYMDYGFMQAIVRQERVPIDDIWFAGSKLNYYYLGQAAAVFLCRIAFVTPEFGYNFMLCTIFAAMALMLFTLCYGFLNSIDGMKKWSIVVGSIVASMLGICGGNGHWLRFGVIEQLIRKITGTQADVSYWFPDSTVYIGIEPDAIDRCKHEFPSYTIVLGDLHAHVCNMMFTIPLLAILFDYVLTREDLRAEQSNNYVIDFKSTNGRIDINKIRKMFFSKHIILIGLLLGLFRGVNYWDFPIYYVIAGAIILFCDFKKYGIKILTFICVLLKGAVILLLGTIAMIPFNMYFEKMVSGIYLCENHSPINKLATIWAFHVIVCICLLLYIFVIKKIAKGDARGLVWANSEYTVHELSIVAFTLCGLGLLLVPEVIYVKDIYGDSYARYNTMFKLTYQAFIIMSIVGGICVGIFLNARDAVGNRRNKDNKYIVLKVLAILFTFMSIIYAGYLGWSVKAWFGNVTNISSRSGISATEFINSSPDYDNVREAIDIINQDSRRYINIIEEAADSYQPEARVSVFTGTSTIVGWYVHEWMWHNDSDMVRERSDEVFNFYSLGNKEYCKEIIDKYQINYIFVSPRATTKYNVNYNGFYDLGECLWKSDDGQSLLLKVD